jgi:transcriptional regulator with XRE-family HTH domain
MNDELHTVGDFLRHWRRRRRVSQLELALAASISQRHLSFVESGRAAPSRAMVLRLAEQLQLPFRERNALLVSAGFAPVYRERGLDEPDLSAAHRVVELILAGHSPYPALAVDRHWMLVSANDAAARLLTGVDPSLLQPPINVLRLSFHPHGLAGRILNFDHWRRHVLHRLSKQVDAVADPVLVALLEELTQYPSPVAARTRRKFDDLAGIAVPLELQTEAGVLCFLSTITVFGTPVDITLSELAIESFFPANAETAETMRQLASGSRAAPVADRG